MRLPSVLISLALVCSTLGATEVVAESLPEGVRLRPNRIHPGITAWPLQFEADVDAALATALITLNVRPTDPNSHLLSESQQKLPFLN